MPNKAKVPGSARDGDIDTRSSDAGEKQADKLKSHAELANKTETPASDRDAKDERAGAVKDRTAR